MCEIKELNIGSKESFVASPVDNWRRFHINTSLSKEAVKEKVFNTFIPLYVDLNESMPAEEMTGLGSFNDGDSDATLGNIGGDNLSSAKPILDSEDVNDMLKGGSDNSVSSSETPEMDTDYLDVVNDGESVSNSLRRNHDNDVESIKNIVYQGLDVSADVFYLLEK